MLAEFGMAAFLLLRGSCVLVLRGASSRSTHLPFFYVNGHFDCNCHYCYIVKIPLNKRRLTLCVSSVTSYSTMAATA